MNFIDLFSGAGGLSEGFINAGFDPIAHVEMDKSACFTLETRLGYHELKNSNKLDTYYDYLLDNISRESFLAQIDSSKLRSVLNIGIGGKKNEEIFRKIDICAGNREVDLIIGGPPCQAYSLVGRARDKKGMKDDPRNYLYKEYAKFLKYYNPKVFVFENVLGLINAEKGTYFKNMKKYFKSIGYELDFRVLQAEEYGVLQKRRRVILIGWRKNLPFAYPEFSKIGNNYTVSDILNDLKEIRPGEENKITKYKEFGSKYLRTNKLRNGADFVTQHVARPHNKRDLEIYRIAIDQMEKGIRLKYDTLPNHLKTHKNQKSFLDRFKVVDPNDYSHTVVAHIAKDGHYYIHPSAKQLRSISVREAARIQSFSDDYYFEGGRTSAFKQIGNAVPPLMSFEIANKIKAQFNEV